MLRTGLGAFMDTCLPRSPGHELTRRVAYRSSTAHRHVDCAPMINDDSARRASFCVRPAVAGDEGALFDMIQELARFERLEALVTGGAAALREHLFGERPVAAALIAEAEQAPAGYALFFTTYSTFLTRPGVYLEDLFVRESHRARGIGRALLAEVRRVAEARGAARLEWSVLDWNERAIQFYRSFGAEVLPDWRVFRLRLG